MLATPLTDNVDFDKVYEPAEDSFLLLDALEQEKDFINSTFKCPAVLEIGTGSGIVAAFMASSIVKNGYTLASDINPFACSGVLKTASDNKCSATLDAIQCSLTSALRPGSVDILVFNPPYVPSSNVPEYPTDESKLLDLALDGGESGMEVTDQLLDQLQNILSVNGVAYIIFCASNKPEQVKSKMENKGFTMDQVIFRRAGWELLYVFKIAQDPSRTADS